MALTIQPCLKEHLGAWSGEVSLAGATLLSREATAVFLQGGGRPSSVAQEL